MNHSDRVLQCLPVIATACALLCPGLGSAATVSYTTSQTPGVVAEASNSTANFAGATLNLIQFNTGLGELNSIEISMAFVYTANLVAGPDGGSGGSSLGSSFYVGGEGYSGTGCGNGGEAGPNIVFSFLTHCSGDSTPWTTSGGNPQIPVVMEGNGTVLWVWNDNPSSFQFSAVNSSGTLSGARLASGEMVGFSFLWPVSERI